MSLYNIIHGVNPAMVMFLPMLGEKHPNEYPRFRDCFLKEDGDTYQIQVYTRVGGNNRGEGYGEEELYKHPNFITTQDDDFDNTFASYFFSIPDEWKKDFDIILKDGIASVSKAYQDRLYKVFPKLKDKFDEAFKDKKEITNG